MPKHFSPRDLAELKIEHFIFHIITKEAEGPRFLDAVPLVQSQFEFFREQFKLAAATSVEYQFIDPENSSTYQDIDKLVTTPNQNFVAATKRLAQSFHSYHRGNVNDGIFIIALVALPQAGRLLFLVKMDYEKVLDFVVQDEAQTSRAILREVTNPIVQSKEAIQKVAIVDVGKQYDWDVLANDRATGSQPTVSRYFSDFLQIKPLETDVSWMNKTVATALEWARSNKEELSALPGHYKEKAVDYMESHPVFETDEFVDNMLHEEPEDLRPTLTASFRNVLDQTGISAVSYSPDYEALSDKPGRMITKEGVRIEFKGSMAANFIEIREPDETGEKVYQIIIRTEDIEFKK